MGLLLSVLVVCVGVLEAVSCFRHIRRGLTWLPRRALPILSEREPSLDDDVSSSSEEEISKILVGTNGGGNYGLTPILTEHRRNTPILREDEEDDVITYVENNIDACCGHVVAEPFRPISPTEGGGVDKPATEDDADDFETLATVVANGSTSLEELFEQIYVENETNVEAVVRPLSVQCVHTDARPQPTTPLKTRADISWPVFHPDTPVIKRPPGAGLPSDDSIDEDSDTPPTSILQDKSSSSLPQPSSIPSSCTSQPAGDPPVVTVVEKVVVIDDHFEAPTDEDERVVRELLRAYEEADDVDKQLDEIFETTKSENVADISTIYDRLAGGETAEENGNVEECEAERRVERTEGNVDVEVEERLGNVPDIAGPLEEALAGDSQVISAAAEYRSEGRDENPRHQAFSEPLETQEVVNRIRENVEEGIEEVKVCKEIVEPEKTREIVEKLEEIPQDENVNENEFELHDGSRTTAEERPVSLKEILEPSLSDVVSASLDSASVDVPSISVDAGDEDAVVSLGKDITTKESSIKRRKSYREKKRSVTPKSSSTESVTEEGVVERRPSGNVLEVNGKTDVGQESDDVFENEEAVERMSAVDDLHFEYPVVKTSSLEIGAEKLLEDQVVANSEVVERTSADNVLEMGGKTEVEQSPVVSSPSTDVVDVGKCDGKLEDSVEEAPASDTVQIAALPDDNVSNLTATQEIQEQVVQSPGEEIIQTKVLEDVETVVEPQTDVEVKDESKITLGDNICDLPATLEMQEQVVQSPSEEILQGKVVEEAETIVEPQTEAGVKEESKMIEERIQTVDMLAAPLEEVPGGKEVSSVIESREEVEPSQVESVVKPTSSEESKDDTQLPQDVTVTSKETEVDKKVSCEDLLATNEIEVEIEKTSSNLSASSEVEVKKEVSSEDLSSINEKEVEVEKEVISENIMTMRSENVVEVAKESINDSNLSATREKLFDKEVGSDGNVTTTNENEDLPNEDDCVVVKIEGTPPSAAPPVDDDIEDLVDVVVPRRESAATLNKELLPVEVVHGAEHGVEAAVYATESQERRLRQTARTESVEHAPPAAPTATRDNDDDSDDEDAVEAGTARQPPAQGAFWLIFSGEYTKAMSKDWHSGHFCCWQCDESLTGQRYVLRDDHPYCIKCYESVFANMCEECNKTIGIDSKDLSYKDKHWHEACFLCNKCRVSLVDKQFGSKADKIYCGNCYDSQFASRCDGCGEIFRAGTKKMEYKTRQWHEKCFCCCVCKSAIGTKSFIPREQEIYCAACYEEKFATRCVKCNKIITSGGVTYKNEPWHRECFTCTHCSASLAGQRFTSRDEKPYCADCFGELFAKRCTACVKPITGIGGTRFISFEDRHWHNDCFICASCKTSLVGRGFITDADDIICPECAKQKLM